MNLKNKISLFFLFIATITFSQDWIKTDITDFASINFPIIAELSETEEKTIFSTSDESAIYIVSISKLTDKQSARLTKDEIPRLYQGVAEGAAKAANADIVSMKEVMISGLPALELEYYAPTNPDLPNQRFKRILYVNQHVISIDFWPLTSLNDISNKNKTKFFNSFLLHSGLIKNSSEVTSDIKSKATTKFETGFFIGKIVFYLFLIALIIGVIFLIRNVLKKNKNKKHKNHPLEKTPVKTIIITCKKCDSENNSNSKYCNRCGFELPKNQ